jgi:sugar/nucleoside kinase (ribokinase family)
MLAAGGLKRLAADPAKLQDAVTFAAATGALTCTGPGAIAPQPQLAEVERLAASAAAARR